MTSVPGSVTSARDLANIFLIFLKAKGRKTVLTAWRGQTRRQAPSAGHLACRLRSCGNHVPKTAPKEKRRGDAAREAGGRPAKPRPSTFGRSSPDHRGPQGGGGQLELALPVPVSFNTLQPPSRVQGVTITRPGRPTRMAHPEFQRRNHPNCIL